jgi:hypothetical protein
VSDVIDPLGFHLAGAALADGTDAELAELGEQVALGLLGSPSLAAEPGDALTGVVASARRVLFEAELPLPEFTTCLGRLDALRVRVADQLVSLARLTAVQIEQRLRETVLRDASYAAVWHGGLMSF